MHSNQGNPKQALGITYACMPLARWHILAEPITVVLTVLHVHAERNITTSTTSTQEGTGWTQIST